MNQLKRLEDFIDGHKARSCSLDIDDGYGASAWHVSINTEHGRIEAGEGLNRNTNPNAYGAFVYAKDQNDWPGLEATLELALDRAQDKVEFPDFRPKSYEYEGKIYREFPATALWCMGYCDGFMSGIATYRGKYYYCKCYQASDSNATRWYWMHPITLEEFQKEERSHKSYEKVYGLHRTYDKFGYKRYRPITKEEKYWNLIRNSLNPINIWKVCREAKNIEDSDKIWLRRNEYMKRPPIGYFNKNWREEYEG